MPEPAGGAASAPPPEVVTVDGYGPPLTPEQRADAAAAHRDQAQADYDAAMAAAQHTRDQADSLRESAAAMEDKAEADKQAALEQADAIDAGGVSRP